MFAPLLLAALLAALYLYGTRTYGYWATRGVPHARPLPFFGTDVRRYLQLASVTQSAAATYRAHPGAPFAGYYRGMKPELVLRDPELVRRVLAVDWVYFSSRGLAPLHGEAEPLLRNLFFADGDLWRLLRQRLTPAFSSGRLRAMFPLVVARAERLQTRLGDAVGSRGVVLDARDVMARYTTDFIGSVGFGLDPDSLNDDASPFRKLGAKIFATSPTRALTTVLKSLFPRLFSWLKFLGQELEDDVLALVGGIQRQRGGRPAGRHDFIDLLLELQLRGRIAVESLERTGPDGAPARVELELDDTLVAAQAFIFFAAGFETSSSATSYTLHQLAHHPDAQRRAQASVDRALVAHGGALSYDAVKEMTYLEWALLEGMRLFPSSGTLTRRCTRAYTLPGTRVTLDPDVLVSVPVQALHTDPEHWPSPDDYRPERFAPDEVARRHKFVYLPFGEGPRSCIGGRLGLMQSLAGLAAVLARFSVRPAPDAPRHLLSDPRATIVQNIVGGVPLLFHERHAVPDSADFRPL